MSWRGLRIGYNACLAANGSTSRSPIRILWDASSSIKWILFGWLLTQAFFMTWWDIFQYPFGKSDVDNYFFVIPTQVLQGADLRHILMQGLVRVIPMHLFIFIIPALYWFGTALPVYILFGENSLYVYVFGTCSLACFLITALWSQLLSLSAMLWAMVAWKTFKKREEVDPMMPDNVKNFKYLILVVALAAISLTYIPTAYFYIALYGPMSLFILATAAAMLWIPNYFWWFKENIDWNPAWVFFIFVCPVVVYKLFFGKQKWTEAQQGRWYILTLSRLGRGLMFLFPWMGVSLTRKEKILVFAWWGFMMLIFIIGFWQEATCQPGAFCRTWAGMR
jgi:hypothetical protein